MTLQSDKWSLYRWMYRSRRFEEAVKALWEEGAVPGEMHLGVGEEAIVAGVVAHLQDGDTMALDHRGTPPLVMRGVDLEQLLRECLGHPEGLCRGHGGHMHLFSRELGAASSGIVGAAGPMAAGFALAAEALDPGKVAVGFFGDGAMNQGMLLEAMNLAAAWELPVLFVCKDSGWAITTPSSSVTGGRLVERARGFGLAAASVDGGDVEAVLRAAGRAVDRARRGRGPSLLHATCVHLEGHFLGDPLMKTLENPRRELGPLTGPLLKSARESRAPWAARAGGLGKLTATITRFAATHYRPRRDPVKRFRAKLPRRSEKLAQMEREIDDEIERIVAQVRADPTAMGANRLGGGTT